MIRRTGRSVAFDTWSFFHWGDVALVTEECLDPAGDWETFGFLEVTGEMSQWTRTIVRYKSAEAAAEGHAKVLKVLTFGEDDKWGHAFTKLELALQTLALQRPERETR